ncbi:MAG: TetR family transcriptional regulator [Pseudomonadales bacterium]
MTPYHAQPRQVVGRRRKRQHVQERGNTRRKQLLEAAATLLQSTPVEELSFKRVSERAGVPEGSAYHFFANRYDLLGALAKDIAEQFALGFRGVVANRQFMSWHELADTLIDQAVKMYRENPAAMQIWLSGRAPAQVRLADHVSGIAISSVIHDIFNDFFELPKLPEHFDPFFLFLEMCDVPLSVSVIEHDTITDAMVGEAKRAGKGYLGTYLPPALQQRTD